MLAKFVQKFFKMSNSSVAPVDTLAAENEAEMKKHGTININQYTTKKTVAQGMLDIALLTSNASQLKYILQTGEKMQFYSVLLWLICSSIILQLVLGILYISMHGLRELHLQTPGYKRWANIVNQVGLYICYVVSIINLVVSSFTPAVPPRTTTTIVVGGFFLMIGGLNLNDKPDHKRATLLNDVILLFIFLITSVNVIISGFGLNSSVP